MCVCLGGWPKNPSLHKCNASIKCGRFHFSEKWEPKYQVQSMQGRKSKKINWSSEEEERWRKVWAMWGWEPTVLLFGQPLPLTQLLPTTVHCLGNPLIQPTASPLWYMLVQATKTGLGGSQLGLKCTPASSSSLGTSWFLGQCGFRLSSFQLCNLPLEHISGTFGSIYQV